MLPRLKLYLTLLTYGINLVALNIVRKMQDSAAVKLTSVMGKNFSYLMLGIMNDKDL